MDQKLNNSVMNTITKFAGVLVISFIALVLNAQDKKQLLADFTGSDWQKVKESKISLENMQMIVIPDLILLLDKKEKVKLTSTGSLIYPGAEKFFGHGQILDYDIDYIAIRAGWLIEETAFQNFGFTGIHLPKDEMSDFIRITFPEYYSNPDNLKKIQLASQDELRSIIQDLAVRQTKKWWEEESVDFSRLNALVDALRSPDEKQQVKALFYMRNGTSKCDGLSKDVYYDLLIKEVGRLSSSDIQRISENAKLILLDTKFEWLALKLQ
jgi:hypothetical protein